MVVSGLPTRNHNAHAKEIARMSLSILEQVEQFIIRHQPDMPLQARVGVHSGTSLHVHIKGGFLYFICLL